MKVLSIPTQEGEEYEKKYGGLDEEKAKKKKKSHGN